MKADVHLPLGIRGPSEDKAAGDELRDDSGTKALRSSEQSGLAGSFSILAHYFPTSSASFQKTQHELPLAGKSHCFDPNLKMFSQDEGTADRLVIPSHRRDLKL